MQFTGPNAALEQAIAADDPRAVAAALTGGADANARGEHGVTPLEYAIGIGKRNAALALVKARANPNLKDVEGDSAVSVAVTAYKRDPSLLALVLDAGGDPNTTRPDGDPVITRFVNDQNLDAIAYLHGRGASIDAEIAERPMIVDAAIVNDWDVVLQLIRLGARLDTPKVREGLMFAFKGPEVTPPDHPLYAAKVDVWRRLKTLGLDPTPPMGLQ